MWWNIFNSMPQPFAEGYLPPRDGHEVYYVQYGNPQGIPVLSFHGGPGGSSRSKYAKLFDLRKYRFIQFDQRGCGNSKYTELCAHNTTTDLIADAVHLLAYLHINTPVIAHGASWGSTLALLFAELQPQMVQKIIISSIFLARPEDDEWVYKQSERFYPDLWYIMRKQVRSNDIRAEYYRLLFSSKKKDNLKALSYMGSYEYMLGQLQPKFEQLSELLPQNLNSARIAFYYARNNYFIAANQIIRNTHKIKNIPTLIVHNRLDLCCPVKQAWDLHQALPKSKLTIVAGYGHSTPKLLKIIKKKTQQFLEE